MDSLDSHASKSLYVFSALSELAPAYRTAAGMAGGGGGGAEDTGDSSVPPLEMDVDAASGSKSIVVRLR
eukprot:CAMPEP_0117081234 /NCGR_PEP_ID=MMETSP0472-20121206/57268_1 /TAXON_ID=693140 ORGANISM="Tiarina fusus, Strain LIS" /NCGR_SAMPLE_ID=MMETSP0472 /ASSEMBLY_ACC=CAM_ASM_000603 /LENGTH=68 /DNA_ID=CAMNT_0004809107 /DNA_START=322 /DNA_END=531 /DNA_ORIENTATION=+